jgi:hypothetical protein
MADGETLPEEKSHLNFKKGGILKWQIMMLE